MQRTAVINKDQRGILTLSVLLVVFLLIVLVQGLLFAVKEEHSKQIAELHEEQKRLLAASLLQAAEETRQTDNLSEIVLAPVILQPGNLTVQPSLHVVDEVQLGIRQIEARVETTAASWSLYRIFCSPPGGARHPIYTYNIFALLGVNGKLPTGEKVLDGSSGVLLPAINYADYGNFGLRQLPTAEELTDYGLQQRLYFNTVNGAETYELPPKTTISGDGVLIDEVVIVVGNSCTASGRLTLISGSGISIGDNVKLDQAFLFAQKNITIGDNVTINGIIVSGGKLKVGNNFAFTGERKLLDTFATVRYFL